MDPRPIDMLQQKLFSRNTLWQIGTTNGNGNADKGLMSSVATKIFTEIEGFPKVDALK